MKRMHILSMILAILIGLFSGCGSNSSPTVATPIPTQNIEPVTQSYWGEGSLQSIGSTFQLGGSSTITIESAFVDEGKANVILIHNYDPAALQPVWTNPPSVGQYYPDRGLHIEMQNRQDGPWINVGAEGLAPNAKAYTWDEVQYMKEQVIATGESGADKFTGLRDGYKPMRYQVSVPVYAGAPEGDSFFSLRITETAHKITAIDAEGETAKQENVAQGIFGVCIPATPYPNVHRISYNSGNNSYKLNVDGLCAPGYLRLSMKINPTDKEKATQQCETLYFDAGLQFSFTNEDGEPSGILFIKDAFGGIVEKDFTLEPSDDFTYLEYTLRDPVGLVYPPTIVFNAEGSDDYADMLKGLSFSLDTTTGEVTKK